MPGSETSEHRWKEFDELVLVGDQTGFSKPSGLLNPMNTRKSSGRLSKIVVHFGVPNKINTPIWGAQKRDLTAWGA